MSKTVFWKIKFFSKKNFKKKFFRKNNLLVKSVLNVLILKQKGLKPVFGKKNFGPFFIFKNSYFLDNGPKKPKNN